MCMRDVYNKVYVCTYGFQQCVSMSMHIVYTILYCVLVLHIYSVRTCVYILRSFCSKIVRCIQHVSYAAQP